jgi:predicted nucleic acid-binding protein
VKVLDTDVCIEILRGNPRVLQWRRHTHAPFVITWITACELEYGAAKSAHPRQDTRAGKRSASRRDPRTPAARR